MDSYDRVDDLYDTTRDVFRALDDYDEPVVTFQAWAHPYEVASQITFLSDKTPVWVFLVGDAVSGRMRWDEDEETPCVVNSDGTTWLDLANIDWDVDDSVLEGVAIDITQRYEHRLNPRAGGVTRHWPSKDAFLTDSS